MKELLDNCCGIDVHKKNIVACVMYRQGSVTKKKIATFATDTPSLLEFAKWLAGFGITEVAMESTGIYWIPVFNILEQNGLNVILANARNVKNVSGRKTDIKDCEWICKLLRNGLIEKSFIPPEKIREIRMLTRHRETLIQDRTRCKNRIHKILECHNIKLSTVLSDIFGKTGWNLIKQIAKNTLNIQQVVSNLPPNTKASPKKFEAALQGSLTEVSREIIISLIEQIEFLSQNITKIEASLSKHGKELEKEVECLSTIPGIDQIGAYRILGEIGKDMTQFPSANHLTSWACVCPGNHESAGKKYNTAIRKGNNYLKTLLVQMAWAASRTKTYLGAKYRRLVIRKGKKKALIALARKMLTICYHMLEKKKPYQELGFSFLDTLKKPDKTKYYLKRLEHLGYQVI